MTPIVDSINRLIIRELGTMNDKIIKAADGIVFELKRLNDNLERLSNLNQ